MNEWMMVCDVMDVERNFCYFLHLLSSNWSQTVSFQFTDGSRLIQSEKNSTAK